MKNQGKTSPEHSMGASQLCSPGREALTPLGSPHRPPRRRYKLLQPARRSMRVSSDRFYWGNASPCTSEFANVARILIPQGKRKTAGSTTRAKGSGLEFVHLITIAKAGWVPWSPGFPVVAGQWQL